MYSLQNLFYVFVFLYRNEAYLPRTLIAVMDHNNNLARDPALSASGDLKYHKVYSKRSKNWSAQVTKTDETYDFWPLLVSRILKKRVADQETVLRKVITPADHPKNIAPTIAMKPVPKTSDLVQKSLSRYSK